MIDWIRDFHENYPTIFNVGFCIFAACYAAYKLALVFIVLDWFGFFNTKKKK